MKNAPGSDMLPIPDGYELLKRGGAYFEALGPVYAKKAGEHGLVIGLRIGSGHLNANGVAHGGMLATLADSALGIGILLVNDQKPLATVNLTTDFMEAARLGDWLEAHVEIQRVGGRLAFATCFLQVGERRVLRASGVFSMSGKSR